MVQIFDESHNEIGENCDKEMSLCYYYKIGSCENDFDCKNENEIGIDIGFWNENVVKSYDIDYGSDCDNDLSEVYLGENF